MKLTWFAGTTIRVQIGGAILVADAGGAPRGVELRELLSGADRAFSLAAPDSTIAMADSLNWRRRPQQRAIDEASAPAPIDLVRFAGGVVLVDAPGEPPLVLAAAPVLPPSGRWISESVVVLFGDRIAVAATGKALLALHPPRLMAIAASDGVDAIFAALAPVLDGAGLVALEAGLALEI